jgi:hypothetical protein
MVSVDFAEDVVLEVLLDSFGMQNLRIPLFASSSPIGIEVNHDLLLGCSGNLLSFF